MSIEGSSDSKAFHDFELHGWETNAKGYLQHFARLTRQIDTAILKAAGVRHGSRVLDVCTGPGMLASKALSLGAEAVGLDFSTKAIEHAKRAVPKGKFRLGDAQALPFDDGSFDAVICGYGVIHLANPQKAMFEMYRVLASDGRAAISVWAPPAPNNGFGIIFGALKAHGDLTVSLPHGPDYFQFSEYDAMVSALTSVGFRDVDVERIEQNWRMEAPSELIDAVVEGTVRAAAIFDAQTEEASRAVKDAIIEGMGQYRSSDGGYDVPMPALIGSGLK